TASVGWLTSSQIASSGRGFAHQGSGKPALADDGAGLVHELDCDRMAERGGAACPRTASAGDLERSDRFRVPARVPCRELVATVGDQVVHADGELALSV